MPQYDPLQVQQQRTGNETALIELARLKQSQASEEEVMAFYRQHPELLVGGGSVLGSLQTAPGAPGGMPAPGPITQSPLDGGPSQQIPASPDLSRFANVPPTGGGPIPPNVMGQTMPTVTPPQGSPGVPTLATLGGQPQGPMPGPQNPLLEMARRDPRAALMLQQQIQARQEQQWQMQEQGLSNRIKVVDYLGRMAQGATDQDSWTQLRAEADRIDPGSGGRLPQQYSKEVRDRVVAQAVSVKDALGLQIEEGKAATDARKQQFAERQAAAGVPKYTEDSTLNVAIDRRMQQAGIPRGTPPPEAILTQAQEDVETGKIRVSAAHGSGQVFDTPEGKRVLRPGTTVAQPLYNEKGEPLQPKPTQAEQETATFSNLAREGHMGAVELEKKGFAPGFWAKTADKLPLSMGNYLTSDEYQQYKGYVMDFAQAWLRKTSKGAITEAEWKFVDERYFPQPGNSKKEIENKSQAREKVIKELENESKGTGRTGTQAPPTSQGSTGTLKPVAQMNAEETRAEIAAIKARGGR